MKKIIDNQYKESIVQKYKIIYGDFWRHYAVPHDFKNELYHERNFCPYCGSPLPPKYVSKFDQEIPFAGRAQIDHMDPLILGGEESIRNAIYVCDSCNYKKGSMPFLEWLKKLEPRYSKLAKEIYIEKHGHSPEDFKEGCETSRYDSSYWELMYDADELKKMYPTPKVDGPPNNQPIVIEIKISEETFSKLQSIIDRNKNLEKNDQ